MDTLGHIDLVQNGYDYLFQNGPDYLHDNGAGQRAILRKFQDYPRNSVEGGARLQCQSGVPGRYFHPFQPAQVVQHHRSIMADLIGGGVDAGQITLQPLLDTGV
jgi:hypothetical protein